MGANPNTSPPVDGGSILPLPYPINIYRAI